MQEIGHKKKVSLFLPNINSKLDVEAAEKRFVSRSSLGHQAKKGIVSGGIFRNRGKSFGSAFVIGDQINPFSQRRKGGEHYLEKSAATPVETVPGSADDIIK